MKRTLPNEMKNRKIQKKMKLFQRQKGKKQPKPKPSNVSRKRKEKKESLKRPKISKGQKVPTMLRISDQTNPEPEE